MQFISGIQEMCTIIVFENLLSSRWAHREASLPILPQGLGEQSPQEEGANQKTFSTVERSEAKGAGATAAERSIVRSKGREGVG